MSGNTPLTLLTIPPEMRENIYRLILNPGANRLFEPDEYTDYDYRDAFALFKINRQTYNEARRVFRDLNIFVRIETPWPEAQEHVAFEGHVPVLMKAERAAKFREHSLNVVIDAPENQIQHYGPQSFIILLDDLEKFTRSWYYADLSHPGLNQHLRLHLQLRDPYTPEWEEKRMPKWKQQLLLAPFTIIKDLGMMVVDGDPKPFASVEKGLREEQQLPHASPEHCLSESTRLKAEGNVELNNGRYHNALKIYGQAWEAIHIIVKGRQRHIHADAFFSKDLVEEPYKGKNGQAERLMLRVQLVANTTLAYLKLEEYEEVRYWGLRSIYRLREALGAGEWHDLPPEDEAAIRFPGSDQMGKIYYRTALACKELGDKTQARKLLKVAEVYLPNDKIIKRELAACALQLG